MFGFFVFIVSLVAGLPINTPIEIGLSVVNDTYYFPLKIGSHSSKLNFLIDTIGDFTFIPSSNSVFPKSGRFNSKFSTSLKKTDSSQSINLEINNSSIINYNGNYVHDKLQISNRKLKEFPMYLDVENSMGVVGLGGNSDLLNYLKDKNLIKKKSFSLYYDRKNTLLDQSTLQIGGYVPYYFNNSVIKLPLANSFFPVTDLIIDKQSLKGDYPARIKASSSFIKVPPSVFQKIPKYGTLNPETGKQHLLNCYDFKSFDIFHDWIFRFGNSNISIPFRNLVIHNNNDNLNNDCYFGVEKSDGDYYEFGSSFLNSVYLNIDYDDNYVQLSQAKLSENVVFHTQYDKKWDVNGFVWGDDYLMNEIVPVNMYKYPVASWNLRDLTKDVVVSN